MTPKRCKGCKQFEGFAGLNKDGYCPDCAKKEKTK